MKSTLIFLFLLLFCSCNFRFYTNGKFDHKTKGLTSKWRTTNDSCIIIGKDDKIPNGAILVNNTEIKSPFIWLTMHLPPEIIDNELKTEAQKAGANVIQIESQQGNKFTRLCVPAKMYLLKEPFITNYKKAKDSIANYRNKNLCSLHIRSFETYSKVEVYFNDSLIGSLPRSWSKSKNKPKLNFTSTHEGVLWLKVEGRKHKMEALNIPYHQIRAEFKISMGNEYFINIDIAKGHNIFSEVKNISETGWYYW